MEYEGSAADEDAMDEVAEKATYTGTKQERIDARVAARKQARIDARVALRVLLRTIARTEDRKMKRLTKRMGDKLYADWVAALLVEN